MKVEDKALVKRKIPLLTLKALQPMEVGLYWEEIEPLLTRAVAVCEGELSIENLYEQMRQGVARPFLCIRDEIVEAILLIHFLQYPLRTIAFVSAIAGKNIKDFVIFWPAVERFCFDMGATELRTEAPPKVARLWRMLKLPFVTKREVLSCNLRGFLS